MEQKRAAELLSQNLKKIFAFSVSRLYDKSQAEDLTNQIVCNVLEAVPSLKNDSSFYGFLWKIADNTFKSYIRNNQNNTVAYDEAYIGAYWETPEENYIKSEELNTLRRELSLLSKQYRQVTVSYYIHGKSCSEISESLGISIEMVKYYLFQTRKKLKEGFSMTREFGEKSYNPGVFRMDFWGSVNSYSHLFDRSLPCNIVLAAYEKPLSIEDLSIELGVSATYLEDELDILLENEIIRKINGKYQTDIIILTDEYEKEVKEAVRPIYKREAEKVLNETEKLFPAFKAIDFKGNDYSDNRLKWTLINIAMYYGLIIADGAMTNRFGSYPKLSNGSDGFIYGYDNDYVNHHFNGIYGDCSNKAETAHFSVENYRIIEKCQLWKPHIWNDAMEAMCDAILEKSPNEDNEILIEYIKEGVISCNDNRLSAEFPVFTEKSYEEVKKLLQPISESVAECMKEICEKAAGILKKQVPKALKEKCEQLAFIHYQMDVMAFIVEELAEKEYLAIPEKKENLCIFGIKKI